MKTVAVTSDKVYAANGSSIFYFDKGDQSANVLSKYDGLHDVHVSQLGYNASQNTVIIGYETGNIDLVQGNDIILYNDISRASFVGSKKINHFFMDDEFVYISGDYGVTVYNLKKREVKESYLTLGPGGFVNAVYASTFTANKDSIFLATSLGVMTAKVSQAINLLDYSSWYTFHAPDSIDTANVVSVATYSGIIYAAVQNKGIYYYNGNKWRKTTVPVTNGSELRSLTNSPNGILACIDTAIFLIKSPTSWTIQMNVDTNIAPSQAYYDSDNTLWVATSSAGLIRYSNNTSNTIYPNGPFVNNVFRLDYYNNSIVSLTGGYSSYGAQTYFGNWNSIFENNTSWNRLFYSATPSSFRNFIGATYNPNNSTLYLSSYENGLIAIDANQNATIYTNTNSPLKRSGATQTGDLLIGETAVDKDGYLWVPNRGVNTGLYNIHKLSPKGIWSSYVLSSALASNVVRVTIDDLDNKWISTVGAGQTGVIVFNEKKNQIRSLTNTPGLGGLPDANVNCVTKDLKGTMYVGTNVGLAICYDPSIIYKTGVDLTTPIFDGFPIFFERNVLAIAVDGGNRKWVGTNDGIWLMNEDLTQVLLYFDTDNSPLLSDYVLDIQINPISGEVFFATPEGIMSYRGTATVGDDNFSNVKVFPNPVKPDFSGLVGISGLASDVSVKITDVAGNLVYETIAKGGTAVWNVRDYNGRRAATGVYLIFCASTDGTSKFVSKIAVVE
ncbi:MAG TPA: hypothetical protein VNB90_06555 [Cytophagaceae bacterium]|nr:hypothetical protein [Cytophagaceae bacterium]